MHSPPPARHQQSYGGKAPVRVLQAPAYQKTSMSSHKPIGGGSVSLGTGGAFETSSTSSTDSTSSSSSSQEPITNQQQPLLLLKEHVDYRNYVFQALESVSKVTFDNYCGPTPESNWVVPNMLLVGAYPASTDDEETLDLITSILKQGVNKFVCLQQEVRTDCPTTLTGILFSPHPYNFSLSLSFSLHLFFIGSLPHYSTGNSV